MLNTQKQLIEPGQDKGPESHLVEHVRGLLETVSDKFEAAQAAMTEVARLIADPANIDELMQHGPGIVLSDELRDRLAWLLPRAELMAGVVGFLREPSAETLERLAWWSGLDLAATGECVAAFSQKFKHGDREDDYGPAVDADRHRVLGSPKRYFLIGVLSLEFGMGESALRSMFDCRRKDIDLGRSAYAGLTEGTKAVFRCRAAFFAKRRSAPSVACQPPQGPQPQVETQHPSSANRASLSKKKRK